jgi:hypothetical protein
MKNLYLRWKYNLPKKMKKVWWNRTLHMTEYIFPVLTWSGIRYLKCKVGLIVPMEKLKDGRYAYYRVVKISKSPGGDWLFDTDPIDCDMVFEGINRKLGIGGLDENEYPMRNKC